MFPSEAFAAVRSQSLRERPLAVTIQGVRVVLFRDERGTARAIGDRCAHRGIPLSKGRVKSGCIECPYHGWTYDGDGSCVHIPDLEAPMRIPARARVPAFETRESHGFVWVRLEPSRAAHWPLPVLAEASDPGWRAVWHSRDVACDWRFMVENVLDGAHLPFIHEGSLDGDSWGFLWARGYRQRRDTTPPNLQIEESVAGFVASAETQLPKGERRAFRFRLLLPSTVSVEVDDSRFRVRVWVHVVPTESGRCRVEHGFFRNFLTNRLFDRPFLANARKILGEDSRAVELQQLAYDREGRRWEVSVQRDRIALLFRKLIRADADAAAEPRFAESQALLDGE